MEGFLVTMNIEKASDSLDHNFLISTLEKYGFGKNFILWVKILLRDQESCVINGCTTTKYFSLERGPRQGYPISAFLFVLALEVLFILIKSKPEIEGMTKKKWKKWKKCLSCEHITDCLACRTAHIFVQSSKQ